MGPFHQLARSVKTTQPSLEAKKRYVEQNREKVRESKRKWNAKNRNYFPLWRAANLTEQQQKARLRKAKKYGLLEVPPPQKCSICLTREANCFDHDHSTGLFRGMLCQRCNASLGMLGEENLARAMNYVSNVKGRG